jgi:hypothetical protein
MRYIFLPEEKMIKYLIVCLCLILPQEISPAISHVPTIITGSTTLSSGEFVVVFSAPRWNYTAIGTSFLEDAYTSQTCSIICNGIYSIAVQMATFKPDKRTPGLFLFDGSQNLLLVNENESPDTFYWSLTINRI